MSDEEIGEIQQSLAILRERSEAAERARQTTQNWMSAIVGALCLQIVLTVFFAGGKVVMLDRLVEDVREIKADLYQVRK